MSTIKSSDEHLTINADGSSKDIKFQANGVEKASISSAGAFTSTTIDATKLTGTIPNFTSTGIDDNADATAIKIDSSERVAIGNTDAGNYYNYADNLVVYDAADNAGMTIATGGTNKSCSLYFADGTSAPATYEGYIEYTHSNNSMIFGTNHATRLSIDSTGAVTMPSQPAFLAELSTVQNNIAVGSAVDVLFATERFDNNSDFNPSTYTFTSPITGKYQFNIYIRLQNVDTASPYYHVYFVTSNRTYFDIITPYYTSDVSYVNMAVNVLADMDANDTAKVFIYQAGGTAQTDIGYSNDSHFSGYLVC